MTHTDPLAGYAGIIGSGYADDGTSEAADADRETAALQRLIEDGTLAPPAAAAVRGNLGTVAAILAHRKTLSDTGAALIDKIEETATDTLDNAATTALETGISEIRDEIGSADAKTGTLVTVSTGALAGLLAFAHAHVPPLAAAMLWGAAAATAAALAVLLCGVIRPRLGAAARTGTFGTTVHLQDAVDAESRAELHRWREARLELFDRVAVAKHRKVAVAVDLLCVALVLLVSGAVLVATGGIL